MAATRAGCCRPSRCSVQHAADQLLQLGLRLHGRGVPFLLLLVLVRLLRGWRQRRLLRSLRLLSLHVSCLGSLCNRICDGTAGQRPSRQTGALLCRQAGALLGCWLRLLLAVVPGPLLWALPREAAAAMRSRCQAKLCRHM